MSSIGACGSLAWSEISAKSLPEALKCLEKLPTPEISVPGSIECFSATPTGLILVGLGNGQLIKASFSPSPESILMLGAPDHSKRVGCVQISAVEKVCLSASEDAAVKVWSLVENREIATLVGHSGPITSVTFLKSDTCCLSSSEDTTFRLWSLETYQELGRFEGHTDPISKLALATGGELGLVAISGDMAGTIRLWDVENKVEIGKIEGQAEWITALAVCGDTFLTGEFMGAVTRWSVRDGSRVATYVGHTAYISCFSVTPDQSQFASGAHDYTVRVWSLASNAQIALLKGHKEEVTEVWLSYNGRLCFSASGDASVRLWDVLAGSMVACLEGHKGTINGLFVSPECDFCVSGATDKTIKLWTVDPWKADLLLRQHTELVNGLELSKDGKICVSASSDSVVSVWAVKEGREIGRYQHRGVVNCVKFVGGQKWVASGGGRPALKIWSYDTLTEVAILQGHDAEVQSLAVTSSVLISGDEEGRIKMWSLPDLTDLASFLSHTNRIVELAVTPDETTCVSASFDSSLRLWDLTNQREIGELGSHASSVYAIAVSTNGDTCVSGSLDGTMKMWSVSQRREIAAFVGHTKAVSRLALTPDQQFCITTSSDHYLRMWAMADQRLVVKFPLVVMRVAVTSDSRFCVCAGAEGRITVWSIADWREVMVVPCNTDMLSIVALAPNDSYVVAGAVSGSVSMHYLSLPGGSFAGMQASSVIKVSIGKMESGEAVHSSVAATSVGPWGFNALHLAAFYGHDARLQDWLSEGIPLIKGSFGSPLTLSLSRNAIKCTNAILEHLVGIAKSSKNDEIWPSFLAVSDDLPCVLLSNSPILVQFLSVLMRTPGGPPVPQFVTPKFTGLKAVKQYPNRLLPVGDFDASTEDSPGTELVHFSISLVRWNVSAGSLSSLSLLSSLSRCRYRDSLQSLFATTLIDEKWNQFYPLTLGLTVGYWTLLVNLVCLMLRYFPGAPLPITFIALNGVFLLYEFVQMFATGRSYFSDFWNILDLLRGILSVIWTFLLIHKIEDSHLTLLTVFLCFLRGFTYFRSFRMTRAFVYTTMVVVSEVYTFLVILAYSVFSFGMMAAALHQGSTVGASWTSGFNLIMGEFDNADYGVMEWVVFTAGSVVNVVIMLNLLISILGEAYGKSRISMKENDYHLMLTLIQEYESMLFWLRSSGQPTLMAACYLPSEFPADSKADSEKENRSIIDRKVEALREEMDGQFSGVNGRLDEVQKSVESLEKKIEALVEAIKTKG